MESNIFGLKPHTYALQDYRRGELTLIEGATWADWDHSGRLVYAKKGKMYAVRVAGGVAGEAMELADFNAHRPERIEAPGWAKRW